MPPKMETFNKRVVKVVAPSLEEKAEWAARAHTAGYNSLSDYIRALILHDRSERVQELEQEAQEGRRLAREIEDVRREARTYKDAYMKAQQDLRALSERYDRLAKATGDGAIRLNTAEALLNGLALKFGQVTNQTSGKNARPPTGGVSKQDIDRLILVMRELGYFKEGTP